MKEMNRGVLVKWFFLVIVAGFVVTPGLWAQAQATQAWAARYKPRVDAGLPGHRI